MQPVTSLAVDRAPFPVVDCAGCGTRSLTWLDAADMGDVLRCLACDAAVDEATVVRAGRRDVEALGWVLVDDVKKSRRTDPKAGCGAGGLYSCGSGGCSSGSCGTGGGCGSGGCGK